MRKVRELWRVAGDFDMGTQQVVDILCAHTEIEGKGAST